MNNFLHDVSDKNNFIIPISLIDKLQVSIKELSDSTGLNASSLETESLAQTEAIQHRLREMVDILNKIIPWSKNINQAYKWYKTEPLPSFAELTAMELVKQGKSGVVMQYLERIDKGGFS